MQDSTKNLCDFYVFSVFWFVMEGGCPSRFTGGVGVGPFLKYAQFEDIGSILVVRKRGR
jgi:hypothetical protein